MTVIKQCSCKHKYQDQIYGAGNRVFNAKKKTDKAQQEYRCTVCRRVQS